MYKISIILPVFNVEDTLENAFHSILNQSIGFENLEVIFIDDKSTDNSLNIIKDLSNQHPNVKAISLNKNSGFAGKPRNVGIKNATADYLMFLDPDDLFLNNACELLYKNITENNLDVVSANYNINRDSKITRNNWDLLKLNENQSIQVQSIDESTQLLLPTPSVWSKIFKKEFILKENIRFLEGVPAQDLVFVSQSLLKANGIKFINTPIVEYIPRQSGENKSITSKRTKEILAGFIKSYTELYNLAGNYNKEYAWIGPRNLFFWIKQFVLSDLPIADKVDLLHMANPLFEEFIKTDKIKHPEFLEGFLNFIEKKDYIAASKLSRKLDIFYDDKILTQNIKNKEIFLLFYGLDIEIGGLAKASFTRANILKQNGYKVTLLNLNKSKNFEYIVENFHDIGYLDESIDIINIIEYYANKNTLNANTQYIHKDKNDYFAEKIKTKDNATIINYYNNSKKESLIKSESYFNKYSCIKTYHKETQKTKEKYFTRDGFNYLNVVKKEFEELYELHDRNTDLKIRFNSMFDFNTCFVEEILLNCENKSFLINENSGKIPNFNNVSSDIAYKIASIHTNPYKKEYHYGSPLRDDFTILKNIDKLDYIVVLTEALKRDLIKEFNVKNIVAIPNILNLSEYPKQDYPKDKNTFSIFARLSPEKNISDAIKAFEIVVQNRNDAILNIYGRAVTPNELKEEEKLKTLVKELNLEDNVIFKGHSNNVSEEMSKSLATLFVSKFEGLGMVVLESMINSTPVISYDIHYGPSDFIVNEKNGYLVKQNDILGLANCILELLKNPSKSDEMGRLAHEDILNRINSEKLFLKWENVLKEVYLNSIKEDIKIQEKIDPKLVTEVKKLEKLKIKLYKQSHELYMENKHLKKQINAKNSSKLKKLFKKLKI